MAQNMVIAIIFALPLLAYIANAEPIILNIREFGANNHTDISKVLLEVWKKACESDVSAKIVIPKGHFQLSQVKLLGPCKSPIELHIRGKLHAPESTLPDPKEEWITINYVNNLEISGGGLLNGHGQKAWKKNDCHKNTNCEKLPINLSLNFINNSYIHDIRSRDSKNWHMNCISSHNVTFQRIALSAPAESPNTDGLHLARASDIYVIDSIIKTGDDCISIGDESVDFHITNVTCGPGHGISIGSLGKYDKEKDVTGMYIKNCTFKGTEHGVRIKTWPSTPIKLHVSKLYFEDLIMENVGIPIIIDQEYCPWNQCSKAAPSLVKISDVFIKNVRGTSSTPNAIVFACSKAHGCNNVKMENINLKYKGNLGATTSTCSNVKPILTGKNSLKICNA